MFKWLAFIFICFMVFAESPDGLDDGHALVDIIDPNMTKADINTKEYLIEYDHVSSFTSLTYKNKEYRLPNKNMRYLIVDMWFKNKTDKVFIVTEETFTMSSFSWESWSAYKKPEQGFGGNILGATVQPNQVIVGYLVFSTIGVYDLKFRFSDTKKFIYWSFTTGLTN